MSQKSNKKLRKLVSDNTKDGNPTKSSLRRLKKSYNKLSSVTRGQFIKTLGAINGKIAIETQKSLDGREAKE